MKQCYKLIFRSDNETYATILADLRAERNEWLEHMFYSQHKYLRITRAWSIRYYYMGVAMINPR